LDYDFIILGGVSMVKFFKELKGHLMTGISYMLPLIIGASLVVAVPKLIGVAFGIATLDVYKDQGGIFHFLYLIEQAGWTGVGLLNTVLAGFVAYSIGDKPAIGAGFIAGAIASHTNAGFIGAIIGAMLAGYSCQWVKKHFHLPSAFSSTMPLVIIPLIATGLVGIVMGAILSGPLSAINQALVDWLSMMCQSDTNMVIMAAILGCMIGFDLGGPVNKSAWMAGNALLASNIWQPNIYINCAILIPPLGYAIATAIRGSRFSENLRESGKGNWVMGFIGITEGAIPYTMVNPAKLIPINMVSCAVGAALTAFLGAKAIMPPVGGLYGFVSIGNGWAYIIGTVVGAFLLAVLATCFVDFTTEKEEEFSEDDDEIKLEIG